MPNTLKSLSNVDGLIATSFVEIDTGITLGSILGSKAFDIEIAGAINASVVQEKKRALDALKPTDNIEDIVVSLSTQYHLMRMMPERPGEFLYVVLDRAVANLTMARLAMARLAMAHAVDETAVDETVPPAARALRAVPSYPRAYFKQADEKTAHLKKTGDSLSRAFPRGS